MTSLRLSSASYCGGGRFRVAGPERGVAMPVFKRVLCPERLRKVPEQFSWIDQRLVRDRHIAYQRPLYQVLALAERRPAQGQPTPLGDLLSGSLEKK